MSRSGCLTTSQLNGFLAGVADETRRSHFESHLSQCAACRHRLVEAHRMAEPMAQVVADEALKQQVRGLLPTRLPSTSQRRTTRSWWAAAAVMLIAGAGALWWQSESAVDSAGISGSTDSNMVWRADAAISPRLEILTPSPAVEINNLELSWRPIERVGPYTVTFLDELGNVVWRVDSDQETWRSDQHPLAGGRQYFWYVSAPLGQRDRVESEISSFVLAP